MATVNWPTTLPMPLANGFSIVGKPFSRNEVVQSGRPRSVRNRAGGFELGGGTIGNKVSMNFVFRMTLSEYSDFSTFFDTTWGSLTPVSGDSLQFTIGSYTFDGWPISDVTTTRTANGWTVAFRFEVSSWHTVVGGFTDDEMHPICPTIPSQMQISNGLQVRRDQRSFLFTEDSLNFSRLSVSGANFLVGTLQFQLDGFSDAVRVLNWWASHLKFGALQFKWDASKFNLGPINGRTAEDYYCAKLTDVPDIEYSGNFGQCSFPVRIWIPNPDVEVFYKVPEILDWMLVEADYNVLESETILTNPTNEIHDGRGASTWEP